MEDIVFYLYITFLYSIKFHDTTAPIANTFANMYCRDNLVVKRYIIRSEAPRLNTKSSRYIANCFLRFDVDLNDHNLFIVKLNQNTMVRAMELDVITDSPAISLKTYNSVSSMAALLKPVIK